jgi:nitroreductase
MIVPIVKSSTAFDPVERDTLLSSSRDAADAAIVSRMLAARYSCRGFRSEAVPRPLLERLFGMAQFSASWCNAQPWQVIVTSGEATERFRSGLLAHIASRPDDVPDFEFPAAYEGPYQARRRETARQLYDSVGIEWGDREASRLQSLENFRLFGAPHVALITSDAKLGVYAAVDCGVFVGNLTLAAQSLGLATIVQAALARYPSFVRRHFGLGEERRLVCGVSLGYGDDDHPANGFRTRRASLDQAVAWADS